MPEKANAQAVEVTEKIGKDGEKVAVLKLYTEITNDARALALLTGREVVIADATAAGKAKWGGYVTAVSLRPHPDRATGVVATAKVRGGPDLEKLIGRSLNLERAQESLLGEAE